MDLPMDFELDSWLRYVDNLPSLDVESYITLDARLGWRPKENLEISIVGQNLLDDRHPEFGQPWFIHYVPTEVEHSVYGKVTWHF
jgi:iron complex outermembrane receptor protein